MTTQKYPIDSLVVYIGASQNGTTRGFPGKVISWSADSGYRVTGPFNVTDFSYRENDLVPLEEYKLNEALQTTICRELSRGHTLRSEYGFKYLLKQSIVVDSLEAVTHVYKKAFEINCIYWELGVSAAILKANEYKENEFKTLREALETMYSGLYELDARNNSLVIHYPKVTIVNSRNEKITIYDLYVKFELYPSTNLRGPLGFTATRTHTQYTSGYSHSHLSTGTATSFNSFCMGDGTPIRKFMDKFRNQPAFATSVDEYLMFFAVLDAYVHWESLEGGPYIKINQVVGRSATIPSLISAEVTITYNKMLEELKELPLQIVNGSQFALHETPELEEVLERVSTQKVIKLDNGTLLNPASSGSKEVPDKILAPRVLTFKGKDIPALITNKIDDGAEPVKSTLVTLPALKQAVYNKLQQLVNPNFYLEEQIKQIDK